MKKKKKKRKTKNRSRKGKKTEMSEPRERKICKLFAAASPAGFPK